MTSIITGYEYDVFISYRQKDNKYDGWVTEFVDNLKKELEATFKEDVSIYFDENPHDGLLEIHNVDKSLENKLKALVFIPVISQTYCDPKSFAWQNEFIVFNKIAREDQFGMDIKLTGGNVISRIIPVKIHELDETDSVLLENELGYRLRAIEFIFNGTGVNRPLKPDDNPDKNLNKTFYRDQINKVANAVKEIIYGLHPDPKKRISKTYQTRAGAGYTEVQPASVPAKPLTAKRIPISAVFISSFAILVIISLLFFYPGWLRNSKTATSTPDYVRKTIAVMPVSNLSGNSELDWIPQSIQDEIIMPLSRINELIVRPKQSTLQFKGSEESLQQIAKKLRVNNLVYSSVKGTENDLRVEVQLVEAFPEDRVIWSSTFIIPWKELSSIFPEIINHILDGIMVKPSSLEAKKISGKQPVNPDLLKACARGEFYINQLTDEGFKTGLKFLNDAMAMDPADPLPYLKLALGYSNAGHAAGIGDEAANRAKSYALKALELDSTLSDAHVVLATRYLYTDWDFVKAEYHLKRAMELNPSSSTAYTNYGWFLVLLHKNDEAARAMETAIEIDPTDPLMQGYLAWMYLWTGRSREAITEAQKTIQVDPNYIMAYYVMGSAYSEMGMHFEAIEAHKKGLAISPGFEVGLGVAYARAGQKENALEVAAGMEKNIDKWNAWGLAEIYAALGDKDKSIYYLEEAYKLHQDFIPWIRFDNNLRILFDDPRFQGIVNRLNLPV
jgi:TolB-like protein/tetratricopeptide (TPR) repeat protein